MRLDDWTIVDGPTKAALARGVVLRAQNLLARQVFPVHSHDWGQFVYATSGTLVVTVEGAWHVITPEQAIWVPADIAHATGAFAGAEFRTLYIDRGLTDGLPGACTMFSVTPILRALIVEKEAVASREETDAYQTKLDALILEQLHRLPVHTFHLPWPVSPALQGLCEALYADPAEAGGADAWAQHFGMSPRTLARRFERELGLGLREWRQKLRLFRALEWLGSSKTVTEIALDLGYSSAAAFAHMFRTETGHTPTEWRTGQKRRLPHTTDDR